MQNLNAPVDRRGASIAVVDIEALIAIEGVQCFGVGAAFSCSHAALHVPHDLARCCPLLAFELGR
jgi:hypothetical protein